MQHNAHVLAWLRRLTWQWFVNGDFVYPNWS